MFLLHILAEMRREMVQMRTINAIMILYASFRGL